jgi:predicted DNA-binding protein (MmcQ/YjbR family)
MRAAAGLPAATRGQPFGEGIEVLTVGGKVCTIVGALRGAPIVSVKCRPAHGAALVLEHAEIFPGYHLNKRHWISIGAGPGIDEAFVEDLIGNSYDLVVAGLPRDRRPLDPDRRVPPGHHDLP